MARGENEAAESDAEHDPQSGDRRVSESEIPARNLDLLGQADPDSEAGRDEQRPPPAEDKTEDETTDDEHRDDDGGLIGPRGRRVKLA
jgi:hypothetical protein